MNVIESLYNLYNGFNGKKEIIGYTVNGLPVPCFFIGSGKPLALFQGAIHGREYISSMLIYEQINYVLRYQKYLKGSICFIPMVNIDGVQICLTKNKLNKANFNGVDLNVNFDVNFGGGIENVFIKGYQNYVGAFPFSENESKILRDITLKLKPTITISYHSKGEEIYWYYNQVNRDVLRDRKIAEYVSKLTGYKLKYTFNSHGGYKDWCIDKLKIPSLTIELGSDSLSHPIEKENLWQILKHNLTTPLLLNSMLWTLNI